MAVTQQKIAEAVGVTRATVSYVLGGRADEMRIGADVVDRVRRVARELGYRPHHAARALVSGRAQTLGLVLGDGEGSVAPFWSGIAEGVEAAALRAKYNVLLIGGEPDGEPAWLRHLQERRIDGLIALGKIAWEVGRCPDIPMPPVTLRALGPEGVPQVGLDARAGYRQAVAHLAELGHRRLLWIGPEEAFANRGLVLQAQAESAGLEAAVVAVGDPAVEAPSLPVDARIARWRDVLARDLPDPLTATCVLCYNDRMALGLYDVLGERGLGIPADVSVIGFDDLEAPMALPAMSTISHEFSLLGAEATRLALDMIEGRVTKKQAIASRRLVPARFLARRSTGPAR